MQTAVHLETLWTGPYLLVVSLLPGPLLLTLSEWQLLDPLISDDHNILLFNTFGFGQITPQLGSTTAPGGCLFIIIHNVVVSLSRGGRRGFITFFPLFPR